LCQIAEVFFAHRASDSFAMTIYIL